MPGRHKEPAFFSPQVVEARRFSIVNRGDKQAHSVAIVHGGLERCAADYHIRRDTFRYYSVEFVSSGRGTLTLAGKTQDVGPGDLFAYGPGVPHEIRSDPRERLTKYFVDFTGRGCRHLLANCGLPPGPSIRTAAPESIGRLFDEMIEAAERRTARSSVICSLILQHLLHRAFETRVPSEYRGTKALDTFRTCRRYMENNYMRGATLRTVAAACGVDVSYLCRLFKRFDRQGPHELLTHLRMTYAAQDLGQNGVLVKQVAQRMGYSDPFQFSRTFRRVHGISPRDYQRLSATRR